MPKDRNKRKRSESSSRSSCSTCSTSTASSSSSSSSNDKVKCTKKGLQKQVRKLQKLRFKSGRYQGKIDSVPVFAGDSNEKQNVQQWLRTVDATGDMFDWDEKARIFCMTNKLKGNAKTWYINQENTNISWRRWKERLIEAFPIQQCVFSKLKELVNVEREPRQNLMDFYYQKLSLGRYCRLEDRVIVDVITNTINDPFLQSGIRAASCVSTKHLLQFLITNAEHRRIPNRYNAVSYNKHQYNKPAVHSRVRSESRESKQIHCYLCGREGHKKAECPKYVSEKI